MKFAELQLEFQKRYYLWSMSEGEKEVEESFPHFWLFKGGTTWKTYQFMKQLSKTEQLAFVRGSIKHAHLDAAKALYQPRSRMENDLIEREMRFATLPTTAEAEHKALSNDGEKAKYASKRELQKAMTERFNSEFGNQCFQKQEVTKGDRGSYFGMKINGWIVQTSFWFGRKASLISYSHSIVSEERIRHPDNPDITGPARTLGIQLCWIWLCTMQWEYLTANDVEPACDSVVDLCGDFFTVLPKLLDGLEYEKITGG